MSNEFTSHMRTGQKEFKKIGNPHLKKKLEEKSLNLIEMVDEEQDKSKKTVNDRRSKNMSEDNRIKRNDAKEDSQRGQLEKERTVGKENLDKNFHAKEFLKKGYIDSYVDYFYLVSRKTPDIKTMKYDKDNYKAGESRELSFAYDSGTLKNIRDLLYQAEDYLREGGTDKINLAIEEYRKLGYTTQYKDSLGAIYFIQKCINLAKRYELITQIIRALTEMGTRFDNSEDFILSMNFKEQAKNLFKHLKEKDYPLEAYIYSSLVQLYKDLSAKAESQNDLLGAINYLNNQLENLINLNNIIYYVKDEKYRESDCIEQQIEAYLKLANLNFKLKHFETTLETLKKLETISENKINSDNDNFYIKGLFLYAQTYEALGMNEKAIEFLNIIASKSQMSVQSTDDNIFAKSELHLGRLYFKQKDLDLSYKNLKSFFRKAKNTDNKELLDIGRVNLGMIRGTKAIKDYIEMIKTSDLNEFLKMKLKFFSDGS